MAKAYPERRIKAGKGGNSVAKQLLGTRGNDITVKVPCGVKAITDEKLIIGKFVQINMFFLRGKHCFTSKAVFLNVKGCKIQGKL